MANTRREDPSRLTRASVEFGREIQRRGLTFKRAADLIGAASSGTVADIVSGRRKAGDDLRVPIRDEFGIPTDWWLQPAEEPAERQAVAS